MTNKMTDCNTCKESLEKCTCITVEHGPLKISFPYENSIPCDHTHWCAKCGEVFKVNNGWVKCTPETLPHAGLKVLIYQYKDINTATLIAYSSDCWLRSDGKTIFTKDIEFWQKLPTPPKE